MNSASATIHDKVAIRCRRGNAAKVQVDDLLTRTTMGHPLLITGRLISAARALTGISHSDLASATKMSLSRLTQLEAGGSAPVPSEHEANAVSRALESFGVVFIPEGDGMGAGVRLKFLRQDAKQIGRLENEGGMVGEDDVP
jgi:transcriptional regulator with XRE-family HTH domain